MLMDKRLSQSPATSVSLGNLRVALLTDDLVAGQELSAAFRLYDIYAFYYQRLSDLWQLLQSEQVDVVIADICKIEEGGLLLQDHPAFKLKENKVHLGLFFNPQHKSLLGAASHLNHIGYINSDLPMSTQLKAILTTAAEHRFLAERFFQQKQENKILQTKHDHLVVEVQLFKDNLAKMFRVAEVVKKFQKRKVSDKKGFMELVASFFESWKLIKGFSIVTLNHSDQKLYSPDLPGQKHKVIDPLWLNETYAQGISSLARQAILPKAYDKLGVDVIVLDLLGVREHPEILLFIQVSGEKLKKVEDSYHWIILENILSNLFKRAMLMGQVNSIPEQSWISIGEAMELLDESKNPITDSGKRLVLINFNEFNTFITHHNSWAFKWKSFLQDFAVGLTEKIRGDFKITIYGTQHLMLFLSQEQFEANFLMVKQWVQKFEYWQYFGTSHLLIPRESMPHVQTVAADSHHFLRRYVLDQRPMDHEISL